MTRHGIPPAEFSSFDAARAAHAYIDARAAPIVVKADGLAAGKGVIGATRADRPHRAVEEILPGSTVGASGKRTLIEDMLAGGAASLILVADSERVLPRATRHGHT